MELTYLVENKLGGVTSLNYNLASHAPPSFKQFVIHIGLQEETMAVSNIAFPVDEERFFYYSRNDNYYQVLKSMWKMIPEKKGALVLNYEPEMAMLDHYPVQQTTYQLVHDDYNFKLALKYHHITDVFIVHNAEIYERLVSSLPERKGDIYYLPHGVTIPAVYRQHEPTAPLKLLFLGRMTASKGIYDLPVISDLLLKNNVSFEWTCIGNGPELNELKSKWGETTYPVSFCLPATNDEVIRICAMHDVFVLPTKFEGSPVSLLETMASGLVPVITRLPGSIADIVSEDIGFAIPMDGNEQFANAITLLFNNRERLAELSHNSREKIVSNFDIKQTALEYHALFSQYEKLHKEKTLKKNKVGSLLDQTYIPAGLTRMVRKAIH